jgi:hypothetical protein
MKKLQASLTEYLNVNKAKPGTKKAWMLEHAFLFGHIATVGTKKVSPIIKLCLMSGRSILTINL